MISVLKKPLLTEKTLALAGHGWYTFVVKPRARKEQIASEISKLYKVKVLKVRTASQHGKIRRSGRKMLKTQKSDWKRALVKLAAGQTLASFTEAIEKPATK